MTLAALALAAGVIVLQQQAALPSLAWAWAVLPLAALSATQRAFVVPLALATGFFWAAFLAHARMADWLAPALEGRDLQVLGVVSGLPAQGERVIVDGIDVEVERIEGRVPAAIIVTPPGDRESGHHG